ncbi:MAG: hypothetical protein B6242_16400 [Anaerolineaceae bacterium 4572_78]|nr:MAG: hypothetical protein B6242_16400 [Anaerolineaceae bacterium 4572_78]
MTGKEKELNVVPVDQETALAMRSDCREDVVDLDKEDLIIPRAKLLQALSPEVSDGDGKVGTIINSLTGEIVPEVFTPLFMFKSWIRFNPRSQADPAYDPNFGPGDIIWRSNEPQDAKVQAESKFGANGEKPLATTFMNFFCVFEGQVEPTIISFANTSYKTGKRLLSLYHFSQQNMFAKKYTLTSKKEVKDIGTYYVLAVNPAGDVTDDEYARYKTLWQNFSSKSRDIEVHQEEGVKEKEDDLGF